MIWLPVSFRQVQLTSAIFKPFGLKVVVCLPFSNSQCGLEFKQRHLSREQFRNLGSTSSLMGLNEDLSNLDQIAANKGWKSNWYQQKPMGKGKSNTNDEAQPDVGSAPIASPALPCLMDAGAASTAGLQLVHDESENRFKLVNGGGAFAWCGQEGEHVSLGKTGDGHDALICSMRGDSSPPIRVRIDKFVQKAVFQLPGGQRRPVHAHASDAFDDGVDDDDEPLAPPAPQRRRIDPPATQPATRKRRAPAPAPAPAPTPERPLRRRMVPPPRRPTVVAVPEPPIESETDSPDVGAPEPDHEPPVVDTGDRKVGRCVICLEDMLLKEDRTSLACSHTYHTSCITQNMRARNLTIERACPLKCHENMQNLVGSDSEQNPLRNAFTRSRRQANSSFAGSADPSGSVEAGAGTIADPSPPTENSVDAPGLTRSQRDRIVQQRALAIERRSKRLAGAAQAGTAPADEVSTTAPAEEARYSKILMIGNCNMT